MYPEVPSVIQPERRGVSTDGGASVWPVDVLDNIQKKTPQIAIRPSRGVSHGRRFE